MRGTFRSQHKITSIFIPRSSVVGAIVGVTPALIVLTTESEVSKNGIRNCIRRSRDDGHVCIDSGTLPTWRVKADLGGFLSRTNRRFATGPRPARMAINHSSRQKADACLRRYFF
jgi:hypothetical protein